MLYAQQVIDTPEFDDLIERLTKNFPDWQAVGTWIYSEEYDTFIDLDSVRFK